MTSSLHHKTQKRGFTLIELLVVIGMIALIAAIAVPMVSRAHRNAIKSAMGADLAVISNALEAYKNDFGDYPRRTVDTVNGNPFTGAALLCWALVAPGPASSPQGGQVAYDGADGPGFRVRGTTGAIKGPYLPVDRFTIGIYSPPGTMTGDPNGAVAPPDPAKADDSIEVIGDRNYRPILYFPANKGADPYATSISGGAYVGNTPQSYFNYLDNNPAKGSVLAIDGAPNILTINVMRFRLGAPGQTAGGMPDGNLYSGQTPLANGHYLLWASGPDTHFGTDDDVANDGNEVQLNTSALPSGLP